MVPEQIDVLWDIWRRELSDSYVKTQGLLAKGKTAQANEAFQQSFVPAAQKVAADAAQIAPSCYKEAGDWPGWVSKFATLTQEAEGALAQGQADAANGKLGALRQHFYDLHRGGKACKSNDLIYAAYSLFGQEAPGAAQLKELADALKDAPASAKANIEASRYIRARSKWAKKVAHATEDGALSPAEVKRLRKATGKFYRDFGNQLEQNFADRPPARSHPAVTWLQGARFHERPERPAGQPAQSIPPTFL